MNDTQNQEPQDLARRTVQLARHIQALPPGNYTVRLEREPSGNMRWQIDDGKPGGVDNGGK